MPAMCPQSIRVWDLPTRVFHWVLALTIVGSVASAKIGGAAMLWHFRLGYLVFGLLLFRLAWGVVGGHWSRFVNFLYTPATVWRYLRGTTAPGQSLEVGHNPLGSLSVWAMLVVLAAQVATGLVADDEIANVGPLNRFVSSASGLSATAWHKTWGQGFIIFLVLAHVAAIVFYLVVKKSNLVRPMLSGNKLLATPTPASADTPLTRLLALVLALASALIVVAVVRLGG